MVYLWKSKNFINSNELVTFCNDCNIAPQHCHIIYNSNQKVYILFYIEQL